MYSNPQFALLHEYMEMRQNGFTYELAMKKLYQIITYIEELDYSVYSDLEKLCREIEQYSLIKP